MKGSQQTSTGQTLIGQWTRNQWTCNQWTRRWIGWFALVLVGTLAACSSSDSPPSLPTVTLNASPESITLGESSQLSWTVTGEDVTLSLEPPIDSESDEANSELTSPLTVSPTETTTYTLTATNSAGSASDSVTITVSDATDPDPTPSISAFTAQVDGSDATFAWTLTDAAGVGCTLNVGDGSALLTFADCSSTTTYTHSYAQTGTFTATLTLATGATQTIAVNVEADADDDFVLEDCSNPLVITTQRDLAELTICSTVGGLTLRVTDGAADVITSLAPLANVQEIEGALVIDGLPVTSLEGLENLTSVGSLTITANPALTSLEPLTNLVTVTSDITITGNDLLTALTGLGNLTDFDDSNTVTISNNPALDCSLTPALPFVVDVSTGNLVNCVLPTPEVVNTVYFLPPIDYDVDPIFNDAIDLTPGEPVTVTLERRGSSRAALTVQLETNLPAAFNLLGDTNSGQYQVRFAPGRSRTTFTVIVAGGIPIISREDFRLNLVDAASYDVIEPATLRFRLEPPPSDDSDDDGQDDSDDDSGDDGQGDDGQMVAVMIR